MQILTPGLPVFHYFLPLCIYLTFYLLSFHHHSSFFFQISPLFLDLFIFSPQMTSADVYSSLPPSEFFDIVFQIPLLTGLFCTQLMCVRWTTYYQDLRLTDNYSVGRSNLAGMGIIPLQYIEGQTASSLGLTGQFLRCHTQSHCTDFLLLLID
jgi:hypothetical protein